MINNNLSKLSENQSTSKWKQKNVYSDLPFPTTDAHTS